MASEEQAVENSGIQLDAPILFFFKINSTNLVDKQQLVNIGEIAGAVKENNLSVKIIGAADSKTGTPKHNRALSVKRAKYIAKLLMKALRSKTLNGGSTSLNGGSTSLNGHSASMNEDFILL